MKTKKQWIKKQFEDNSSEQHDFRFSHYEEDKNFSSTATLNSKYAIMVCRHCGLLVKQNTI